MTTVTYSAQDVAAAVDWYRAILGVEPYFERPGDGAPPAYVEFRVGDYQHELGLMDLRYLPETDVARSITYWAVDDVQQSFDRLLTMAANEHQAPIERGEGFVTASVVDPFGNVLGVMRNPHYLEVLRARAEG